MEEKASDGWKVRKLCRVAQFPADGSMQMGVGGAYGAACPLANGLGDSRRWRRMPLYDEEMTIAFIGGTSMKGK
jgi:hypothetical protein